jgi:hypothetical protein
MFEIIKNHAKPILISGMLFVAGIVLGLIIKADENGIFFLANYPNNGGEMLVIGTTTTGISSIDITTISDVESIKLIDELGKLSVKNYISQELRDMVKSSQGPFAKIPVNLYLHFTQDSKITGEVAKACRATPIYGNPVVVYELKDGSDKYKSQGIMSLHAIWEQQKLSKCDLEDSDSYGIWVSRAYVEKWLGPIKPETTGLALKANIIVSSR